MKIKMNPAGFRSFIGRKIEESFSTKTANSDLHVDIVS